MNDVGAREGAEVAQVYVQDLQSTLPRPLKELKGFKKVTLKPGAKQTVSISLDRNAFAYYDPEKKGWIAEAGDFKILIGSSSRDIRLDGTFKLARTTIEK
jgi:beta-glucosidase